MVTQVTSFSRSGLSDWLVQRVTSLILLAYFLCLAGILLGGVDYSAWKAIYATTSMRVFTLLAALSLAAHAWIGLWAVYTDYLTERMLGPRGNTLRRFCQLGTVLALIVYTLWVIQILWG
ncbi:MAG: succinate dehydrogenase, hydrophobic membrane anchor protein [Cellvibrionales bacterium]|jgi:succinate dehydrogenase / fumarate reductase membrane anchor subunit